MTRKPIILAVFAMALVAACGGGTGGTQGPGATTAGGGGGGGGAVDDPCSLLTGDEAGGVLHTAALTPVATPGDPAKCSYALTDGAEALVITVLRNGADAQYQAFIDNGTAEDVTGVGDRALWEPGSERLVFRVGELMIYVGLRDAARTADIFDASTTIGKIIAARLTGGAVPSSLIATPPPIATADVACDLLSADEAAAVLGLGAMKAESSSPTFCYYTLVSTGEMLASTYFQKSGGADVWDGLASSLTTEPVTGLGEKAMFEPSSGVLYVLQGDSIFNANRFLPNLADALDPDRELAEIMLTHL